MTFSCMTSLSPAPVMNLRPELAREKIEGDGLNGSVHVEVDAVIIRVETRHHHAPLVRAAGVVFADLDTREDAFRKV